MPATAQLLPPRSSRSRRPGPAPAALGPAREKEKGMHPHLHWQAKSIRNCYTQHRSSASGDSNARPLRQQPSTLPDELSGQKLSHTYKLLFSVLAGATRLQHTALQHGVCEKNLKKQTEHPCHPCRNSFSFQAVSFVSKSFVSKYDSRDSPTKAGMRPPLKCASD